MSEMALELIRRAKAEGWKRLDLGRTGIVGAVPEEVGELEKLEVLILSDSWWDYEANTSMSTTNSGKPNRISTLPNKLPWGLYRLIMSGCPITNIEVLSRLKNLEYLSLGRTQITNLSALRSLENLEVLDCSVMPTTNFHPISYLKNLRVLSLFESLIIELSQIKLSPKLEYLNIGKTAIESISNIGKLPQLKSLFCFQTKIDSLKGIENFPSLKVLNFSRTAVSDLTPIQNLIGLEEVYFANTNISDLSTLSSLKNLEVIHCPATKITSLLPLKNFIKNGIFSRFEFRIWGKGIYIKDCPLTNPPVEIAQQGNAAILAYWKQQEEEEKVAQKPYFNREIKLVLVGNSNAGKTTLLRYLLKGELGTGHASTHGMEIGNWVTNLQSGDGKDSSLRVRILDFGGQEYYHDTHHLFFTENTAFTLLWDKKSNVMGKVWVDQLSPKGTLKEPVELHQYPLQYWLGAIQHFCEPIPQNNLIDEVPHPTPAEGETIQQDLNQWVPVKKWKRNANSKIRIVEHEADFSAIHLPSAQQFTLVVQTKMDNDGMQFLPQSKLTEEFPFIYDFCAVSLHPDTPMRVVQLKERLLEMLGKMPLLNKEFPGSTLIIRDELENVALSHKAMTVQDFGIWATMVVQKVNPKIELGKNWVKALCNYFAQIGLILYFPQSEITRLKEKIFLRPDLLTQQIYAVLDGLNATQGRFDRKGMKSALDNYLQENDQKPSTDQDLDNLILLMRQFKIIFREGGKEDQFVAPLYLPEQPQQGVQLFLDLFSKPAFRVQYPGFIHKSVILHFFEAFAPQVYSETSAGGGTHFYYWREGIVLKDPKYGAMILIKFFLGKEDEQNPGTYLPAYMDVIPLQQSQGEKAFLEGVMQSLRTINKGWHAEEMVTANGQDFVPLKKVQEAANPTEPNGKPQFVFFHNEKPYLLRDFKDYVTLSMPMKKVFISYSKADTEHLRTLENHLSVFKRNGTIETWNCRKLIPGEKWDGKIQSELEEADIILFLVSADFLATDYIYDVEIKRAVQRQTETNGRIKVVPIIVRPCVWEESPLGIFTSPEKAAPITLSSNTDEAWTKAVRALEKIFRDEASEGIGDKR